MGAAALPDLERALDSLEQRGDESPFFENGRWLILAYARILGVSGLPRLRRMIAAPKLGALVHDLDRAIALSFKLTSYVSAIRPLTRRFHCNRTDEPRDALDQFILAWARGAREWLLTSMGPSGRAALGALLEKQTWETMHRRFWPSNSTDIPALGYKFQLAGSWAEPEENLDLQSPRYGSPDRGTFALETSLFDRYGTKFGTYSIRFITVSVGEPPGYLLYLIDGLQLETLLGAIATCASR
jgi:hypothetical protein